jgi:hypothetical protein
MRIGILLNCHGQGIAAALRALLPQAQVQDFLMQRVWRSPKQRAHVAGVLARCDHVLTWRFGARYESLSTAALLETCPFPRLSSGYHPAHGGWRQSRRADRGVSFAYSGGGVFGRVEGRGGGGAVQPAGVRAARLSG